MLPDSAKVMQEIVGYVGMNRVGVGVGVGLAVVVVTTFEPDETELVQIKLPSALNPVTYCPEGHLQSVHVPAGPVAPVSPGGP